MTKKMHLLVYLLAILTLICGTLSLVINSLTTDETFPLFFSASLLLSLAALVMRFLVIDPEKFFSVIHETDIYDSNQQVLKPSRFFNLMPLAMITCSIADYLMTVDFIFGMLAFLVAQLMYITAYSGIVHLDPRILFNEKSRILTIVSTIVWFLIAIIIYIPFIYSPENIITLAVIPYVFVLIVMVIITFIALGYSSRSLMFRLMLCGGGVFFVISDSILAINKFNSTISIPSMLVGPTYLLAVFMLQYAIMFLHSPDGKSIMKTEL
ncbi:MAG: lysoplasmalogenase family protein [Candidatus Hodarchaeales archaeon]